MLFKKKEEEKKENKIFEKPDFFKFDEYQAGDIKRSFSRKLDELEIIPQEKPRNLKVSSFNRSRLLLAFLILLLLLMALVFRMGYWQIYRSDELKQMAISMQKVDSEIDSVRGTIYDSRMSTLAETVTEYELYGYTQSLYKSKSLKERTREENVNKLAEITGEDRAELIKKLSGNDNLALLADGLSKADVDKLEKYFEGEIVVKTKISRYYPNGAFAAQILGGVNSENSGRTGLEYEYNSVLAGVKGRTVKTTDSQGNTLSNGSAKYYQAQDGYNIVTNIDSVLQHYVEDALETGMERTGASAITCIMMDPKTGKIMAMAQTPEYDPNNSTRPSSSSEYASFKKLSDAKQSEYLSRMWTLEAVSSIYEPGSTYKLIAAAAALDNGTATMNSTYYCGGAINVDGTSLNCLASHGTQDLKVAVGNSCNAALARVALDMGAKKFYNYIDLFGFNDKTGIDLPGETNSIVKSPEGLGNVDLATTGYGQGIAITPIQMLCAVSCFGNKGVLMQPQVVSKIIDNDGNTVKEFKSREVRQVVSEKTAEQMCEIMEYYVSDAGGDQAYVAGYRVGGKTGTANIASGGGYSSKTDCSFIAMAPMDDPKIAMIVIVHKPTKTEYGNFSAGPIVKSIMEKSLMYLGVEREYTDSEAAKSEKNKVEVPNVTNMDSESAIKELTKAGLKYTVMPEDSGNRSFVVVDQYPKTGTKVEKNSMVYLYSE